MAEKIVWVSLGTIPESALGVKKKAAVAVFSKTESA
jgi:hypothetical protein